MPLNLSKSKDLLVQVFYKEVLGISYLRATKIINLMEKEGIVGPMDGSNPRKVLV